MTTTPASTHVPASPTGTQYHLRHEGAHGLVEASIASVAASLRSLTVDGHDLVQGYPESVSAPFGCGIVLVPWPNRVRDGRWMLDGTVQQLDITEVDKNNAIHGLLRNTPYQLVEQRADAVVLGAEVVPQHGYPFHLWSTVEYRLTGNGITVTHEVTNRGADSAPYAVGTHPFIRVGAHDVETLTISASTVEHVMVDDRLNPVGLEPADGDWNLRDGRRVSELKLDDAFRVEPDADGIIRTVLAADDGSETEVWQTGDWEWLQLFITRAFPTPEGPVTAIAIEPMTAPADAFTSGAGLLWIEPGASWSGSWGICRPA